MERRRRPATQGRWLIVGIATGAAASLVLFGVIVAAEPLTCRCAATGAWAAGSGSGSSPCSSRRRPARPARRLPPLLMADDGSRSAYTHVRHVVLSRTLCEEQPDEQLAAIPAHDFHHWARADTLGIRFVFACALPLALIYNLASLLARARSWRSPAGSSAG